jgi:hypothetical protein
MFIIPLFILLFSLLILLIIVLSQKNTPIKKTSTTQSFDLPDEISGLINHYSETRDESTQNGKNALDDLLGSDNSPSGDNTNTDTDTDTDINRDEIYKAFIEAQNEEISGCLSLPILNTCSSGTKLETRSDGTLCCVIDPEQWTPNPGGDLNEILLAVGFEMVVSMAAEQFIEYLGRVITRMRYGNNYGNLLLKGISDEMSLYKRFLNQGLSPEQATQKVLDSVKNNAGDSFRNRLKSEVGEEFIETFAEEVVEDLTEEFIEEAAQSTLLKRTIKKALKDRVGTQLTNEAAEKIMKEIKEQFGQELNEEIFERVAKKLGQETGEASAKRLIKASAVKGMQASLRKLAVTVSTKISTFMSSKTIFLGMGPVGLAILAFEVFFAALDFTNIGTQYADVKHNTIFRKARNRLETYVYDQVLSSLSSDDIKRLNITTDNLSPSDAREIIDTLSPSIIQELNIKNTISDEQLENLGIFSDFNPFFKYNSAEYHPQLITFLYDVHPDDRAEKLNSLYNAMQEQEQNNLIDAVIYSEDTDMLYHADLVEFTSINNTEITDSEFNTRLFADAFDYLNINKDDYLAMPDGDAKDEISIEVTGVYMMYFITEFTNFVISKRDPESPYAFEKRFFDYLITHTKYDHTVIKWVHEYGISLVNEAMCEQYNTIAKERYEQDTQTVSFQIPGGTETISEPYLETGVWSKYYRIPDVDLADQDWNNPTMVLKKFPEEVCFAEVSHETRNVCKEMANSTYNKDHQLCTITPNYCESKSMRYDDNFKGSPFLENTDGINEGIPGNIGNCWTQNVVKAFEFISGEVVTKTMHRACKSSRKYIDKLFKGDLDGWGGPEDDTGGKKKSAPFHENEKILLYGISHLDVINAGVLENKVDNNDIVSSIKNYYNSIEKSHNIPDNRDIYYKIKIENNANKSFKVASGIGFAGAVVSLGATAVAAALYSAVLLDDIEVRVYANNNDYISYNSFHTWSDRTVNIYKGGKIEIIRKTKGDPRVYYSNDLILSKVKTIHCYVESKGGYRVSFDYYDISTEIHDSWFGYTFGQSAYNPAWQINSTVLIYENTGSRVTNDKQLIDTITIESATTKDFNGNNAILAQYSYLHKFAKLKTKLNTIQDIYTYVTSTSLFSNYESSNVSIENHETIITTVQSFFISANDDSVFDVSEYTTIQRYFISLLLDYLKYYEFGDSDDIWIAEVDFTSTNNNPNLETEGFTDTHKSLVSHYIVCKSNAYPSGTSLSDFGRIGSSLDDYINGSRIILYKNDGTFCTALLPTQTNVNKTIITDYYFNHMRCTKPSEYSSFEVFLNKSKFHYRLSIYTSETQDFTDSELVYSILDSDFNNIETWSGDTLPAYIKLDVEIEQPPDEDPEPVYLDTFYFDSAVRDISFT